MSLEVLCPNCVVWVKLEEGLRFEGQRSRGIIAHHSAKSDPQIPLVTAGVQVVPLLPPLIECSYSRRTCEVDDEGWARFLEPDLELAATRRRA